MNLKVGSKESNHSLAKVNQHPPMHQHGWMGAPMHQHGWMGAPFLSFRVLGLTKVVNSS